MPFCVCVCDVLKKMAWGYERWRPGLIQRSLTCTRVQLTTRSKGLWLAEYSCALPFWVCVCDVLNKMGCGYERCLWSTRSQPKVSDLYQSTVVSDAILCLWRPEQDGLWLWEVSLVDQVSTKGLWLVPKYCCKWCPFVSATSWTRWAVAMRGDDQV